MCTCGQCRSTDRRPRPSPTNLPQSPAYPTKRALYIRKRALHIRKRAPYIRKRVYLRLIALHQPRTSVCDSSSQHTATHCNTLQHNIDDAHLWAVAQNRSQTSVCDSFAVCHIQIHQIAATLRDGLKMCVYMNQCAYIHIVCRMPSREIHHIAALLSDG